MDYKMLGKRLKEIRKMRDMSQQDLSYEIEYSIPHISHVENDDRPRKRDSPVYAFRNVSCARSSLSWLSPNVWLRKNRLTLDWYLHTSRSNARLSRNITTRATRYVSPACSAMVSLPFLRSRRRACRP